MSKFSIAQLPDALVPPLGDSAKVVEIISSILNETKEWVCDRLIEEEKNLGHFQQEDIRQRKIQPHVWTDELADFYKQTHMGIIGNVVWNRRTEKLELREWIGNFLQKEFSEPCRVLTIGDGAGYDSLYLSMCGHQVTYSEESKSCIAYAKRIFDLAEQEIRIVDDHKQIEDEKFDVIICLDVLEHVPDPPQMVKALARQLLPDGRMIVHAPFFFVTKHNPTHLKCNRKFSGRTAEIYERNDLVVQAGRFFWDPLVLSNNKKDVATGIDKIKIRLGGMLLGVGRYWNWPHNKIALKTVRHGDSKWLAEFEALKVSHMAESNPMASPNFRKMRAGSTIDQARSKN